MAAVATPGEVAFFRANGFVAIPRCLTTPAELDEMRAAYDDVFSRRGGREDGNHFDLGGPSTGPGDDEKEPILPQILGPDRYNPALRGEQLVANCAALATQLMGAGAEFRPSGHAIFKPPHVGAATPWHQVRRSSFGIPRARCAAAPAPKPAAPAPPPPT
eukprot:COSAG04_NODE_55_length_30619_cov_12.038991_15_plen_160_part_00